MSHDDRRKGRGAECVSLSNIEPPISAKLVSTFVQSSILRKTRLIYANKQSSMAIIIHFFASALLIVVSPIPILQKYGRGAELLAPP